MLKVSKYDPVCAMLKRFEVAIDRTVPRVLKADGKNGFKLQLKKAIRLKFD
jgi:hypothetical protein